MQPYLRVLAFSLLTSSILGLTACEKEGSTPQPTPPPTAPQAQKAALTGQIQPLNAITLVTATNAAGVIVTATPTGSGAYSFPELVVGTYTLVFTPAPGYATPANQTVTLAAGGTTVPVLTVVASAASFTYKVDGVTVTPAYRFSVPMNGSLMLTFPTEGGGTGHAVTFFLDTFPSKTGTFSLVGDEGIEARYSAPNFSTYFTKDFVDQGARGTMTITAISTSPRRMSGTFSFVGVGVGVTTPVPATKTITSGTFTNVPF